MGGNDRTCNLGCHLLVDHIGLALFLDGHHRPAAAGSHAAGGDGLDVGIQLAVGDGLVDGVEHGRAAGGETGCAGAAEDAAAKCLLALLFALRH